MDKNTVKTMIDKPWKLSIFSVLIFSIIVPLSNWGADRINTILPQEFLDISIYNHTIETAMPYFVIGLGIMIKIMLNGKIKYKFTRSYNKLFDNYNSTQANIKATIKPIHTHMDTTIKKFCYDKDRVPTQQYIKDVLMTYLKKNKEQFEVLYDLPETSYNNMTELYNYLKNDIINKYI